MEAAAAIVLAGSASGPRAFSPAWATLAGRPVVAWSLDALESCPAIELVALVAEPARLARFPAAMHASRRRKVCTVALAGGFARPGEQLHAALATIGEQFRIIVLHDAAWPLLTSETLSAALAVANERTVAVAASPVKETIKLVDEARLVRATLPRSRLWQLQTPVVVPRAALVRAVASLRDVDASAHEGWLGALLDACDGCRRRIARAGDGVYIQSRQDLAVTEDLPRWRERGSSS